MVYALTPNKGLDVATIEREAKKLGMDYPSEFKISITTDEKAEKTSETN